MGKGRRVLKLMPSDDAPVLIVVLPTAKKTSLGPLGGGTSMVQYDMERVQKYSSVFGSLMMAGGLVVPFFGLLRQIARRFWSISPGVRGYWRPRVLTFPTLPEIGLVMVRTRNIGPKVAGKYPWNMP